MGKRTEKRIAGALFQRNHGWFVTIDDVLPTLVERLKVRSYLQVYLRCFQTRYPDVNLLSHEVRVRIQADFDTFYSGGHFPDYVFDVYTQQPCVRLTAAE